MHLSRCWATILTVIFGLACSLQNPGNSSSTPDYAKQRQQMIEDQLEPRRIRDRRVLEAMRTVPRHQLVPPEQRRWAYADRPLPIGFNQTISQPFIVALMTQLVSPGVEEKVLEVGTGSGYQAAVLGQLAKQVFTIEIVPELAQRAADDLSKLGYENIQVRAGDGYAGWPEEAPFDVIVITAAASEIPGPLLQQLAPGGRLIMPVGEVYSVQELTLVRREGDQLIYSNISPVRFVPLTRGSAF